MCFLSLIMNTTDFSVSGFFSRRLAISVIFFEILNNDNYKLQAFDVSRCVLYRVIQNELNIFKNLVPNNW